MLIFCREADIMVQRVTYRRRLSYNTKSNRRKIVRTPGGKLVFQYLKKKPNVPKCPMTGIRLKGVKPLRPSEKSRVSLRQKKVYRAYGGMYNDILVLRRKCVSRSDTERHPDRNAICGTEASLKKYSSQPQRRILT